MNSMCGINLKGRLDVVEWDRRPRWGCRWVDLLFTIISRCTMILTGAPLELNHTENQDNYDGSKSLVADQKSRVSTHFIT